MFNFNLGNFGGQLKLDDINGALGNMGSSPLAGPAEPAPQAVDAEVPGQMDQQSRLAGIADKALATEAQTRKQNNRLSTVLGIVGSIYGGPMGGSIGSALGGMANGGRG